LGLLGEGEGGDVDGFDGEGFVAAGATLCKGGREGRRGLVKIFRKQGDDRTLSRSGSKQAKKLPLGPYPRAGHDQRI